MKSVKQSYFFVDESATANLEWPLKPGTYEPDTVYLVQDKSFLNACRKTLWRMIQDSYAAAGGYKGHDNPKKLVKDTACAKIVFDATGNILAFAMYSGRMGGSKRICSAKDCGSVSSTTAVKLIVKDDIEDIDGYYWVEASGGIEHIFAKMGGNPIPNHLAKSVLNINAAVTLDPDGVHYIRPIGKDKERLRKMIFGFKDKETAKRVCSAVANYPDFKLKTNASIAVQEMHESESENRDVCWAYSVVSHMDMLRTEWECREMLPEWKDTIDKALGILKTSPASDARRRESCIEYLENCLADMPRIRVRRIKA